MYKRILVPLDGSPLAERALPHALEIARCMGSQLWLVRVSLAQVYAFGPAADGPMYSEETLEADRKAAVEYLARVRVQLNAPEIIGMAEVLSGVVADTIIDYACTKNIDLIAMSTHGRSGLGRWVYGSVTDKVLRGAHCPTLIVRGQSAD